MPTGRLTDKARLRREEIEEALFLLGSVARDIDEVSLRIQQAIRRTALVADVLEPAQTRLASIRERAHRANQAIGVIWTKEQERKWKSESSSNQ